MSIGQGQGANKAKEALEQALHHPLMDTVSLASARGAIVNFTGGSDLSLYEIQEALTGLQKQTGPQAEIVFGVISDERMRDRLQVILMITGLGAPTLEEAMGIKMAAAPAMAEPALVAEPVRQPIASSSYHDYELPPFFRNRVRG